MSSIIRIDWTVADGNVWTDESGEYDRESSLDLLAQQIADALRAAYPTAGVSVARANVSGAARELVATSDDEDGWVDEQTEEQIKAVADGVWEAGDWYVKADAVWYDLDPKSGELWVVAGPAGYDVADLDPDELPEGFRWVTDEEWAAKADGQAVVA